MMVTCNVGYEGSGVATCQPNGTFTAPSCSGALSLALSVVLFVCIYICCLLILLFCDVGLVMMCVAKVYRARQRKSNILTMRWPAQSLALLLKL